MTETTPTLLGYRMSEKLYDGTRTLIYRGQRESEPKPVVIKFLKNNYPSFKELVQFRNQYTISKNLDFEGIVQPYGLEKYYNGFALVMEDMGGISLSEYMKSNSLELGRFFYIALEIVEALEVLYQNRVIHKDIKPQNILIHPETLDIKLIDFSISSLLPRETQEIQSLNVLEGTLAYISPEQTGRMNRGIDYRTDFYSLGVTFYELLTKQLPFQADDPMELVHCHIAQAPTPPMQLNVSIPQVVNDLILKLMAKTAEDRYQSAFGIRYDLEQCQQQLDVEGQITSFPLGLRDISDRFQIPEKLYGREAEISTLLAAFERVGEGNTEMMLVAGFSGIGKTALVNEVHKPIVQKRGYFIKGKFDQFKRDIPFSALVQAFQGLMRQLLSENADQIEAWKTQILKALGENAQVIIDVIPELEPVIGKQPLVPELEGSAAQNRFNRLLQKFINVFTTAEHPLVIFLDDLQWIDSASRKLIELLMGQTESHYLLLMGAYRDNEVSAAHPLILTLEEIQKTDALVNQITLGPLDQPNLNHLIADTLSCPSEKATPLTELVIQKTKGNPFFTNQFLKFLHEEKLIAFDFDCGYWQCDIAQVKLLAISDDVVEFMALQLQKLPVNTQNVLKLAACIGNQFDLATLAIVHEKSQADTAVDLWKALQEGLIIPISDVYKFFQAQETVETTEVQELLVPYKFLHDRVQQAAYSLISEEQKPTTHLKIGQLLKSHTSEEEVDENIFDIVNQLNQGVSLIFAQAERDELAQLNLQAGNKAKASTAYVAANQYLTIGIELLAADSWNNQYNMTLSLYESAADAAYLSGNFSRQKQLVDLVIENAQFLLDKVNVFEISIQSLAAQNKLLDAVKTTLNILKQFGIHFPENPSNLDFQVVFSETTATLGKRCIEDIANLPKMTDPTQLAIIHILSIGLSAINIAAYKLTPLVVFKAVNLSLQYGNAKESSFFYVMYGLILCGKKGNIEEGYQFGQLASELSDRFHSADIKVRVLVLVNFFITHWKLHLRETLKFFLDAYQKALEGGDLEFANYAVSDYLLYSSFVGKELTILKQEIVTYTKVMVQLKQKNGILYCQLFRQIVLNLIEYSENPGSLMGKVYNEKLILPLHQQANDRFAIFLLYFHKLFLSYLFQNYSQAIENADYAESDLANMVGIFLMPLFHFYDSLTRLASYFDITEAKQKIFRERVTNNQEKMQNWAKHAPMNFQHKFDLVEAERHRVLGENMEAMDFYDRAIAGAKENEYLQEEALANEVAARFYLGWGKKKIAQTYMTEAYYGYARWGAKAKVDDLEKRYPELLSSILSYQSSTFDIDETKSVLSTQAMATATKTGTIYSELLDFSTIIKSSQIISGEIRLEKLLSTLMRVVIENAGAEKSVLILHQEGQLVINALYKQTRTVLAPDDDEANEAIIMQSQPIEDSSEIPVSMINYVSRTHETQVIDDASQEMTFAADPYFIKHQPKSVLCLPILNQGKLTGLLYLENNLTTHAFTSHRLKVLKVLSSQAAISLENALLYHTLEQRVAERTAQLAQANEEITGLNEQLKSDNLRMSAELEVARRLQQMLLPKEAELNQVKQLEIAGFLEPAEEVGGDYYDVLEYEGRVKIGIADVTGHGLESGVLAIMAQAAIRALMTHQETDAIKFLTTLNRTIYDNVQRMDLDKQLTLTLLDYQPSDDGGWLCVSGQHEDVIVVRGGKVELIDTTELGFPIGVIPNIGKYVAKAELSLTSGDIVVLYTDGITEAFNSEQEQYGLERLCEAIEKNRSLSAQDIRQAVIADVRAYMGEQIPLDDITLLIVKQK